MYDQLLYSAGGGIVRNEHKAEQAECVTLAIGLGGTGIICLRNLKKQVYETVKPDDPDEAVPSYSHIKFLAVDSGRSTMEYDRMVNPLDEKGEFFDISSPSIPQVSDLFKRIAERPEYQWLNGEIPYSVSADQRKLETSGTRQIGRLLLMMKSDAFVRRVEFLIMDALRGLPAGVDINVHIFSGLCGGTGSGIFLDVCYLVQRALRYHSNGRMAVFGYFFLPDVDLSTPSISSYEKSYRKLAQNGYAAMKELDYCMNFETNGGEWDQEYRGFHIGPTKNPPVDVCHLISSRTMHGVQPENAYGCALNAVCDYVMQFLTKNELDMQKHMADYRAALQQVRVEHGANCRYFALGASRAVVPMREILTYLGSALFTGFSDIGSKYPTAEEVDQFARENGLDFGGLLHLARKALLFLESTEPHDERMYRGSFTESDLYSPNELILPTGINNYFSKRNEKALMKAEMFFSTLMYDWRRDKTPEGESSISVIRKVFLALEKAVADPARGPFYAARVLKGSEEKNLVNVLEESLGRTKEVIRVLSGHQASMLYEVKKARSEYIHLKFFQNRKMLFNALWEKIDKYYEQDLKIAMLERMRDMIPGMIDQFNALFERLFEPYCKVYSELLDTSAENSLAMRIGAMVLRDPCTVRIPELNFQTMRQLDQTLGNLDFDREASRFNRAFFKAEDVWARGEESRIVKFVSDYVSGVFDEYSSKTMEGYLEMKFGTTDASVLEDMTFRDILAPLSYKALPLFWVNGFYNPNPGKRDFLFIPETSALIHKAMVIHSDGDPFLHLVKSSSPYRIYRLNGLFGVPMFAYCGTDLYKEIYRNEGHFKGFHIYEGTGKESRDWRKLPDLVPFSKTAKPTEEMLQNEKMYRRAVDAGIIRSCDNGTWELAVYEEPEELERFAEEAFNRHDSRAAYEIRGRTEHYLHSRMPVRTMLIPNDGAAGFEDTVRLDYVMSSPALLEEIKKQIDILDKISSIKSRAEALKKDEAMKEEYFYALFTGVICQSSRKMVYLQTKDGVKREVVLTSVLPKKTYWRYAQIYQGLLDYMELDDQIRAAIKEEVRERLEELFDYKEYEEEIRAACNHLEELLADHNERARRYGRFIIRIPEMPPELEEFFVEMMWILWEFRDGYGV